jgi:hypothetical protein
MNAPSTKLQRKPYAKRRTRSDPNGARAAECGRGGGWNTAEGRREPQKIWSGII